MKTTNAQLRELRIVTLNVLTLLDHLGRFHGEPGRLLVEEHSKTLHALGEQVVKELHALNNSAAPKQSVPPADAGMSSTWHQTC
jgi:hypothetical protein